MIDTSELRENILRNTYGIIYAAVQNPDLTAADAQKALEIANLCLPMYEKVALIGSNSSSNWYLMNQDLPESERDMLPRAKHYVKILQALWPAAGPHESV